MILEYMSDFKNHTTSIPSSLWVLHLNNPSCIIYADPSYIYYLYIYIYTDPSSQLARHTSQPVPMFEGEGDQLQSLNSEKQPLIDVSTIEVVSVIMLVVIITLGLRRSPTGRTSLTTS